MLENTGWQKKYYIFLTRTRKTPTTTPMMEREMTCKLSRKTLDLGVNVLINFSIILIIEIPFYLAFVFLIKYQELCSSCFNILEFLEICLILLFTNGLYLYYHLTKVDFFHSERRFFEHSDENKNTNK